MSQNIMDKVFDPFFTTKKWEKEQASVFPSSMAL